MPEYVEVLANVYTVTRWLRDFGPHGLTPSPVDSPAMPNNAVGSNKRGRPPLNLNAIWLDATQTEQDQAQPRSSRRAQGLAFILDPSSKIRRGSSGSQQLVWPHIDGKALEGLDGMSLQAIHAMPRTMVINFGTIFLQVYTRSQWDDEIAEVDTTTRKFRVGIALDVGDWVVAFLTADNVWTPYWAQTASKLPVYHPDVYLGYREFLQAMADAVRERMASFLKTRSRTLKATASQKPEPEKLAINWVRTNVGGVGIYMSEEIFFRAGIHAFTTEYGFFSCPSRVARFCEAFWTLASRAHSQLPELMEPCYNGFVLAPTEEQRMRYTSWLSVHAKKQVRMPERMKTLWLDAQRRLSVPLGDDLEHEMVPPRQLGDASSGLFDIFEPTFIQCALEKSGISLRHLVFGPSEESIPKDNDPLTLVYTELDVLPCKRVFSMADEHVRNTQSFRHIVYNTNSVAIGPLEYCATGRRLARGGSGKRNPLLLICRDSPMLPETFNKRHTASIQHISKGLHKRGKRKRAENKKDSMARGGWHLKTEAKSANDSDTLPIQAQAEVNLSISQLSSSDKPTKKRRLGNDQKLAMGILV
ncbi:hypothetical protein BN946_scf184783.g28 [Trametes cinnabarina]|uniref:Uncharacterized protein n=1 Tax=Pycnoporus cinnabarinus TaxID=5643 RepID=A0A060SCX6_PYCCI|nr:hypothetical protein BN946_scf184783.g28 [Trametes cinnabarina]